MAVREYLWGAELSESKKTAVWDPEAEDKDLENESSGITHFLFLKQATLGQKATNGQRNLIEIEAEDFDGNPIKQPLFSLKLGQSESTVLDIGAQPPLTLRLIEGSGPVFVSGQHALELNEDDMDMFDDEADEAEESPVRQQAKQQQAKKRPASSTDGTAKKAKLNNSDFKKKAAMEDEDSDSEDDEDFNPELPEDSDDEDSDDEDEEDDDDSEMEEGTPDKKQKKGVQTNGEGPKKAKSKGDAEPRSLDKIKQELKKSPSKPKKRNKFTNFVKTQYKLTDDKSIEELWTWYKESVISS